MQLVQALIHMHDFDSKYCKHKKEIYKLSMPKLLPAAIHAILNQISTISMQLNSVTERLTTACRIIYINILIDVAIKYHTDESVSNSCSKFGWNIIHLLMQNIIQ